MIEILRKKTINKLTSISEEMSIKYSKPKILLLDMPENASEKLRDKGFNILTGTLGSPYRVKTTSEYAPLIGDASLSNYSEQEIIIVDFASEIKSAPAGEKLTPNEEDDFWGKCDKGVLDPRVKTSWAIKNFSDRILNNGGVFVIFADPNYDIEVKIGHTEYSGLKITNNGLHSIWNFLSNLSSLLVENDSGSEINISNIGHPASSLLKKYLEKSTFTCTFKDRYFVKNEGWIQLAVNKYGKAVSLASCKGKSGSIIILPQIDDKTGFVSELLSNVLPEISPHLFPEIEKGKWLHGQNYELPKIVELEKRKELAKNELEKKISEVNEEIQNERNQNSWRHDLISETNDALVKSVKKALEFLGFSNVIDMDLERGLENKSRREDLQIRDNNKIIVVDIKGISGIPKDEDIMQAQKHATLLIKETKNTEIQSLAIINHQRNIPPLERQSPFRDEIIKFSEEYMGLLTTWDLFRLVDVFERLNWITSDIIPLFYKTGHIEIIPSNYHFLGNIAKVWTKNFGMKIEQGELRSKSRIAIEMPFPQIFCELKVDTLMINDKKEDFAKSGDEVGISCIENIPKIKEGMRIFLIKNKQDFS